MQVAEGAQPGLLVGEGLRHVSSHQCEVCDAGFEFVAVTEAPLDLAGQIVRYVRGSCDPEHLWVRVHPNHGDALCCEEPRHHPQAPRRSNPLLRDCA